MTTKKLEETKKIIKTITKQFDEKEVYSGKEIKEHIDEIFPGLVEFDIKIDKSIKPYKKIKDE